LLAVTGLVAAWRRRLPGGPLLAGHLVATLVAAAFVGSLGVRGMAEPSLVVLAAITIDSLVREVANRVGVLLAAGHSSGAASRPESPS
jgi:hypothetical protein